jgi:hypothetical protein
MGVGQPGEDGACGNRGDARGHDDIRR